MRESHGRTLGPRLTGWWYACASGTDYPRRLVHDQRPDCSACQLVHRFPPVLRRVGLRDSGVVLAAGPRRAHYMDPDTKVMRTGWPRFLTCGSWYYLPDSGAMAVSCAG